MTEWVIPAVSFTAFGLWLAGLRSSLSRLRRTGAPADVLIVVLATVTLVSAFLAFSSLTYPSVLGTDLVRISLGAARLTLVMGAVAAYVVSRRATP